MYYNQILVIKAFFKFIYRWNTIYYTSWSYLTHLLYIIFPTYIPSSLLIALFVFFASEFVLRYVCAKPTKDKMLNTTHQFLIHTVQHYIPLFIILYISNLRNHLYIGYPELLLLMSTLFIYLCVNRFDYNKIFLEYHNMFNNFESMLV